MYANNSTTLVEDPDLSGWARAKSYTGRPEVGHIISGRKVLQVGRHWSDRAGSAGWYVLVADSSSDLTPTEKADMDRRDRQVRRIKWAKTNGAGKGNCSMCGSRHGAQCPSCS